MISNTCSRKQSGLRYSLDILRILSKREHSFSQLRTAMNGLAAATLSRLLKTLVEEAWVTKSAGGYSAGASFHTASRQLILNPRHLRIIRPILRQLADETKQTVAYVEWAEDGFTFEAKREMPDSYHHLEVGEKNRGFTSNGFGRVIMACMSEVDRQRTCRELNVPLPDLSHERSCLSASGSCDHRDIGYRYMAPITSLSVLHSHSFRCEHATGDDRYLVGVIGVSILPQEITRDREQNLLRAVRRAADVIEHTLDQQGE